MAWRLIAKSFSMSKSRLLSELFFNVELRGRKGRGERFCFFDAVFIPSDKFLIAAKDAKGAWLILKE